MNNPVRLESRISAELYAKSVRRVAALTNRPAGFPYALSEIRGYYLCECDTKKMTTEDGAWGLAGLLQTQVGLTVVKSDPVLIGSPGQENGYTLNCTLTESGVAFDCWPEYGTVIQYLDLCNVTKDNGPKADALWPCVAQYFLARKMYVVPRIIIPIDPRDLVDID